MFFWRLALICYLAVPVQSQAGSSCTVFSTNGIAASNFQYYRFFDFRNLHGATHQRGEKVLKATQDLKNKTVSDATWMDDWYIRDYPRKSPATPSISVNFIPDRVCISQKTDDSPYYSSYLTLSTARVDAEIQEASEITFEEFKAVHASIRVFGRVRGAPGAVAGIFTYLNDTQESAIEILTCDPTNYVQYTNQPSSPGPPDWTPIPGSTVKVTIPDSRRYTDWNVHRLDWTPGRSVFVVNDIKTNTTALHVPVATPPSEIYSNMWSANSTWSGNMDIGESAEFDIQWIELLFNITHAPMSLSPGDNVCAVGFFDQEAEQHSRGLRFGSWGFSALSYGLIFVVWLYWLS